LKTDEKQARVGEIKADLIIKVELEVIESN